jgi:transcription initiation factor IIE alpha subunit
VSDWGGYKALQDEAREIAKAEREKPPTDCPQCGEPLEYNERRSLYNCPLGHYRVTGRR